MKNITYLFKKYLLWFLFLGFAIMAIAIKKDAAIFISQGPYSFGKYIIWLIFFGFFGYSLYCTKKENFFKSVKRINQFYWGRQIGIDLYLGLLLPLAIIFLHGGPLLFFLCLIPVLIYANLFTLLYFALNYDSLVSQFIL